MKAISVHTLWDDCPAFVRRLLSCCWPLIYICYICFSLITVRCCKARLVIHGNTSTVDPGWAPQNDFRRCGVLTSVALLEEEKDHGEFPWRHHTNGDVLQSEHWAHGDQIYLAGTLWRVLSPWRDRTGWNRVTRLLHALSRMAPRRECKGGFGPCERDRQCANTLRGSDAMHPAAISS